MRRLPAIAAWLAVGCGSPVAPSPPALLTISPGTSLLRTGGTETFSGFVANADGSGAPVVPAWSSDNAAVATINGQGFVIAIAAGVCTIRASYKGLTATRSLRVVPWYAGSWAGGYRTTACTAVVGSHCMYNHAPGADTGALAVFLTQLDDQVSGFVDLDGATIQVSGHVAVAGDLSLQGEVSVPGPPVAYVALRLENWTSSIDATTKMLAGHFTHLHAEPMAGAAIPLLTNRVDSDLFNVKPIGPP